MFKITVTVIILENGATNLTYFLNHNSIAYFCDFNTETLTRITSRLY